MSDNDQHFGKVMDVFRSAYVQDNGKIKKDKLHRILCSIDAEKDEAKMQLLLGAAEVDVDDAIDVEQFLRWVFGNGRTCDRPWSAVAERAVEAPEEVYALPEPWRKEEVPEWPDLPGRYRLLRRLGDGAFGEVYAGWDAQDQRDVAVKRVWQLCTGKRDKSEDQKILREVNLMVLLRDPRVVQILDLHWHRAARKSQLYIVMERCETDLDVICKHEAGLSLPQVRRLTYGIFLGCGYLHSKGIYHRDLKPANVLVTRADCGVKLVDFNCSRIMETADGSAARLPATPPPLERAQTQPLWLVLYRAPEVSLRMRYTSALDVWSAGCVVAEMLAVLNTNGRKPVRKLLFVPGNNDDDAVPMRADFLNTIFDVLGEPSEQEAASLPDEARAILAMYRTWRRDTPLEESRIRRNPHGLTSIVPVEADPTAVQLVQSLLRFAPQTRPSCVEALGHPFFDRVTRDEPSERALTRRRSGAKLSCSSQTSLVMSFDDDKELELDELRGHFEALVTDFQCRHQHRRACVQ